LGFEKWQGPIKVHRHGARTPNDGFGFMKPFAIGFNVPFVSYEEKCSHSH
jgi:hypothetical protein